MSNNHSKNRRKAIKAQLYEEGKQAGIAGHHAQTNPYYPSMYFIHWAEGHSEGKHERELKELQEFEENEIHGD